MELLIVVGVLVGAAVAAVRRGADSRPRLASREAEQAALGLTWGLPVGRDAPPHGSALRIAQRVSRHEAAARVLELERVA